MTPIKILIVEDEAAIAMELEIRLMALGYDVIGPVASSEAALQHVQWFTPDLVLMDIRLQGGGDGIETAAEIHSLFQIPVIYLTANADARTLQRAETTEPVGFLSKPFRERELRALIDKVIF